MCQQSNYSIRAKSEIYIGAQQSLLNNDGDYFEKAN